MVLSAVRSASQHGTHELVVLLFKPAVAPAS
jgi:hypothetical protein